jgi:hypothetical protein
MRLVLFYWKDRPRIWIAEQNLRESEAGCFPIVRGSMTLGGRWSFGEHSQEWLCHEANRQKVCYNARHAIGEMGVCGRGRANLGGRLP